MGNSNRCPRCGTELLANVLYGLCPQCLAAAEASRVVGAEKPAAVGAPDCPRPADVPWVHARGSDTGGGGDDFADGGTTPPDVLPRDMPDPAAPPRPVPWDPQSPEEVSTDYPHTIRIKGYDILRELTHGGQGTVYLAVQRSTKRKVAVKVLLDGPFARRAARRRFEREIELAATLKHPNIIALFDSGMTDDGHEYFVMDYIRGVSVTEYVRERKLTLEQTLSLFATMCDAVNHAHQRGIIHRDLKPSNILVDVEGHVHMLDFGLAKTLSEPVESLVSITGQAIGTLAYMPPEQTRGNPDEIDTRSDVYSLSVVLYEMLTGKHPYPVTTNLAEALRNVAEATPAPPSKRWTGETGVHSSSRRHRGHGRCPLDADVETIVLKGLAKERERRYDSAGEMARDVRRYLAGEPVLARRAGTWYHLKKLSSRNKALTGSLLGVLVLLVSGIVTTSWQLREYRALNALLAKEKTKAQEAVELSAVLMAAAGDESAAFGDFITARRLYINRLDQFLSPSGPRPAAASSILMGLLEIGSRKGGGIPLLGSYGENGGVGGFRGHTLRPTSVAVLPGRRWALTSGEDDRLILWDLVTGNQLASQVPSPGPDPDGDTRPPTLRYVAVSPDETRAVTAGSDGVARVWTVQPLREERALDHDDADVWVATVSNDGKVLTGTSGGEMTLWDANTGKQLRTFRKYPEDEPESVAAIAFWPGDSRLAVSACGDRILRLWDLEREDPLRELNAGARSSDHVNSVVISNDGTRVASACFDGTLTIWEVRGSLPDITLERKHVRKGSVARLWRTAFSGDGQKVAAAGNDGNVWVWDVSSGDLLHRFIGQAGGVMGVAFADDHTVVSTGDRTASAGGALMSSLRLWDLESDRGLRTGAGKENRVQNITVSDAGEVTVQTVSERLQLYVGYDGRLHPATGARSRPAEAAAPDGGADSPSWARGGRSVVIAPDRHDSPWVGTNGAGQQAPPKVLTTSADGKAWLAAGEDGAIHLFGAPRGGTGSLTPLRTLEGHRERVTVVGASRNGRFVVSADEQNVVKVWDLMRPAHGRELERQTANALAVLEREPDNAQARSTLGRWYAFRGRGVAGTFQDPARVATGEPTRTAETALNTSH